MQQQQHRELQLLEHLIIQDQQAAIHIIELLPADKVQVNTTGLQQILQLIATVPHGLQVLQAEVAIPGRQTPQALPAGVITQDHRVHQVHQLEAAIRDHRVHQAPQAVAAIRDLQVLQVAAATQVHRGHRVRQAEVVTLLHQGHRVHQVGAVTQVHRGHRVHQAEVVTQVHRGHRAHPVALHALQVAVLRGLRQVVLRDQAAQGDNFKN